MLLEYNLTSCCLLWRHIIQKNICSTDRWEMPYARIRITKIKTNNLSSTYLKVSSVTLLLCSSMKKASFHLLSQDSNMNMFCTKKTTTANKWFQIIKTCENKTMEPLFTQNKNAQLRCLNIFDTDDCLNFNTWQNMYIGCNCTVHITVYASDDNICLT